VGIGLWHALWGVTFALLIFYCLFACLSYLSAGTHYYRLWSDGQSTGALVCIKSPWVRGRRRGRHPAPHRMPFNKRSFFLAATAIELAVLLGYGRSQYTRNRTNVINTTFGGAAGDRLRLHRASRHGVPENFLAAFWHCDGVDTVAWRAGRKPSTCGRGAGGITVEIFDVGARGVSQVGTLCSGPSMSTGGTRGSRRARDGKSPISCRPPGGGQGTPAASDAQRKVLQLLPSLRIKPPPGRCRWWRARRRPLKHFSDA